MESVHSGEYKALLVLLRRLREERQLTQVEVAARLGQPQSFVSKIELGERRIDLADLRLLTQALGVNLVDVVAEWESSLRPRRRR